MGFVSERNVRYYQFESLPTNAVTHGIFTRHGGVSPAPWASLNVGGLVGDARENVLANMQRIFDAMGRSLSTLYDAWQVHGARIVVARSPRPKDQPHEKADGIITNNPKITLFMRFADCVPILLYDPVNKAIGIAHAGWRGTVEQVGYAIVKSMADEFATSPEDVIACIGPSIGPEKYRVGQDVIQEVTRVFAEDVQQVVRQVNGYYYLDLWAANRIALHKAGVKHVEVAQICTASHTSDWYSYRAENGHTGRFGALIALTE